MPTVKKDRLICYTNPNKGEIELVEDWPTNRTFVILMVRGANSTHLKLAQNVVQMMKTLPIEHKKYNA